MSYILEALRKSEQERVRGQALASLAHGAAAPGNVNRSTVLGALLAGNLLLLGGGLWWWSRAPETVAPLAQEVAAGAATVRSASGAAGSQKTMTTGSERLPTTGSAAFSAAATSPGAGGSGTTPIMELERTAASARTSTEAPESDAARSTAARTAAVDQALREFRAARSAPPTVNGSAPVRFESEAVRIAPGMPAAPAKAPLVPGAMPAGFPPLRLSTHIYSSDPASRTVVINGTRLQEGERLDNGVRVIEITEDGARVDYAGQQALVQMQR